MSRGTPPGQESKKPVPVSLPTSPHVPFPCTDCVLCPFTVTNHHREYDSTESRVLRVNYQTEGLEAQSLFPTVSGHHSQSPSVHCFVVVQSLNSVQFFVTPWTAARQASLSFTISQSLFKFMSIESMMPSNHHPLSFPSPPALNLSQHQGLFQ